MRVKGCFNKVTKRCKLLLCFQNDSYLLVNTSRCSIQRLSVISSKHCLCLQLELRPTGTPVRLENPDYLGLKTQTSPDYSLKNFFLGKHDTVDQLNICSIKLRSSHYCLYFADLNFTSQNFRILYWQEPCCSKMPLAPLIMVWPSNFNLSLKIEGMSHVILLCYIISRVWRGHKICNITLDIKFLQVNIPFNSKYQRLQAKS